jgi:hypothetical protein
MKNAYKTGKAVKNGEILHKFHTSRIRQISIQNSTQFFYETGNGNQNK